MHAPKYIPATFYDTEEDEVWTIVYVIPVFDRDRLFADYQYYIKKSKSGKVVPILESYITSRIDGLNLTIVEFG